jgi:hypothetical protein
LVLPVAKRPRPGLLSRFNTVRAPSRRHYARRPNTRMARSFRGFGPARPARRKTPDCYWQAVATFQACRLTLHGIPPPPSLHHTNRSATEKGLPSQQSSPATEHGKHAWERQTAGPMHRAGNYSHPELWLRRRASALGQIGRRPKGRELLKTRLALTRLSWLRPLLKDLWT